MGFIREQFGRITVESRRESFMIHVEEASLREPSSEWWTADLGDLIAALTDYRDSLAARDTRAALAGVSAEATPEGCRAPHCWSEYGTPCGTCPVVAEAAPDEPTRYARRGFGITAPCPGDREPSEDDCARAALAGVSAQAAPERGGVGAIDDGPVGQERSGGSVVAPPPIPDSEFIEPPVMPNMRAPESGGDKPGITPPPNPYPENWKAPGVTSPHEAWEECCTAWQAAGLAARDTNEPKEKP